MKNRKDKCIPVGSIWPAFSLCLRACFLPGGGGYSLGVCSFKSGSLQGGLCIWGCAPRGYAPGKGWYAPGGGIVVSHHALSHTPPVNRMTDRHVLKHNLPKIRLRALKIT